jgi:alanyl-tRNA synthetase
MKTQKLYYDNMYLASCEAVIIAVREDGIVTDRTVAFPEGGGQIGDIGIIVKNGIETPFFDTIKGVGKPLFIPDFPVIQICTPIIHKVSLDNMNKFLVGDKVIIKIDIAHRIKTTIHHSALHLALMAAKKYRPDIVQYIKGCNISTDSARLDFVSQERFSDEDMASINYEVQRIIDDNMQIETFKHNNIEDAWDWKCGDFVIPCGGTHVSRTSQIGNMVVRRRTKGKNLERMIVVVENEFLCTNDYVGY